MCGPIKIRYFLKIDKGQPFIKNKFIAKVADSLHCNKSQVLVQLKSKNVFRQINPQCKKLTYTKKKKGIQTPNFEKIEMIAGEKYFYE